MFGREFDSLHLHPPQNKFGSSTSVIYICVIKNMAHSIQKRKQIETFCNTCGNKFMKVNIFIRLHLIELILLKDILKEMYNL